MSPSFASISPFQTIGYDTKHAPFCTTPLFFFRWRSTFKEPFIGGWVLIAGH